MPKIIIDTDPGIDDAQAIAFALAHPNIELIGLTTVFGNAAVDVTTRNALRILEVFGHPSIPVAAGASDPLILERFPAPDFVHGKDGMGNLNLSAPKNQPQPESAAEFIVRSANEMPGEISLVAIGPLTNIALALRLDPMLPEKIRELVIMGGTVSEPGNVTPLAEANFINDPHAADELLACDWPTTVIGLDVTLKTLLTDKDLETLDAQAGETGKFLSASGQYYLDFYSSRFARGGEHQRACAMHDASAVIYVVAPDAFQTVAGAARVNTDGLGMGQLALDRKGEEYLLPYWQDHPPTHVAMHVDSNRVHDEFITALIQHAPS
ncbi:MAG: nucleoside hydrolase [Pseudomonadota bacterium]